MPHTVTEQLARQQHRDHEDTGDHRPLRQPGKRHALPDRCPSHQQRTSLPRPAPLRKPTYISGPHDDGERIIRKLRRGLGDGNYDFVHMISG